MKRSCLTFLLKASQPGFRFVESLKKHSSADASKLLSFSGSFQVLLRAALGEKARSSSYVAPACRLTAGVCHARWRVKPERLIVKQLFLVEE